MARTDEVSTGTRNREVWLDSSEAASVLGLSAVGLAALVEAGRLTQYGKFLPGGRYRRSDVEALVGSDLAAPRPAVARFVARSARPQTLEIDADLVAGPGEAFLYILELPELGSKVGVSIEPVRRMREHARDAWAWGRTIGRVWLSEPHVNARANELRMKRGHRTEYVPVLFDEMVGEAVRLTFARASVDSSSPL